MIEPTDKSIPPKIITIVIPQANNKFEDICRKTLKIFFCVANDSRVDGFIAKNAHNKIKAIIMPILFFIKNTNFFLVFMRKLFPCVTCADIVFPPILFFCR
jgi:hypothetical protein